MANGLAGSPGFTLSLVVAISENHVIGSSGGLPWRIPSDLKRFRKLTMGHPLIMGRKTLEALPVPLNGRDMIVLSRSAQALTPLRFAKQLEGGRMQSVHSLDEAVAVAGSMAKARGATQAFVIGGAEIFNLTLPLASRIYLTRVHAVVVGDVFWDMHAALANFTEISRMERLTEPDDGFPVTDIVLNRSE
jgi:dihydrofolate reductase